MSTVRTSTKQKYKKEPIRASPMAKGLSSCALLWWPRVSLIWILGADRAPLVRPC